MAQQTVYKGERQSTASQYLRPARGRSNLTILTGAEATSLLISGKRCEGVRFRRNGQMHEARAAREVIVSGGTVNSPKLLELSGIGNPDVLRRHGIEVVHELKGVGENLREHYAASMRWRFNKPGISIARKGRGWRLALEILRYAIFRTGFIAQGLGTMRIYARSSPELEDPDVMMAIAPFIMESGIKGQGRRMSPVEGFFTFTHMQHAESAGSIHIRSADPFAHPLINFRFLDTPADRKAAIGAVRCARKIVAAPPMSENIAEELLPGKHIQTDEDIIEYIRNNGGITSHPVGTCKMGGDEMAVVDSRLRVRGIAGLRVADASVMPTTIAATNIPCMVVGEKCADMILADANA